MTMPAQRTPSPEPRTIPGETTDASAWPLLGFVWRNYRTILVGTVVALVAYGGVVLALRTVFPGTTVASVGLRFPFDGVEAGKYPNGLAFSAQDLLAPVVLERVYADNQIGEAGDFSRFKRSFFITQSNRAQAELRAEYAVKLRDSRLSSAERRELEEDFSARLEGLNTNTFRLSWESGAPLSLAPAQIEKVLLDIPATWARISEESRGVLGYDLALASALPASPADISDNPLLTGELLRRTTGNLSKVAAQLVELPGATLVRATKGETVIDLAEQIDAFNQVVIVPLALVGVKLAYARAPQETLNALRYRKETARRAFTDTERRARELKANYYDYVAQNRPGQAAFAAGASGPDGSAEAGSGVQGTLPGGGMIAQVGGGFIDELIQMREQTQDVAYRQKLNDRVVRAKLDAASAADSLALLEFMQAEARDGDEAGSDTNQGSFAQHAAAANVTLVDYAARLMAFYQAISERNLRPEAGLYVIDEPFWVERSPVLSVARSALGGVAMVTLAMLGVALICAWREFSSART